MEKIIKEEKVIKIASQIKETGGTTYLVGGAVRDYFLGNATLDHDFCVTGISEKVFEKIFPQAKKKGKYFPVYEIEKKEFALARKEKKIGIGHKEFEIESDKTITIEEDLKRRDITINSMAQNILTGEFFDPYHGKEDIEKRMIRKVSESFKEDPLRCYRVARFAAKLQFVVEENTIQTMRSMKKELDTLSVERIFEEFRKALQTEKPSIFFEILKQSQILEVHFKEIFDLIGSLQPIEFHPEGDSYCHTMEALDRGAKLTPKEEVRFSILVHDLGKGITPKEMYPHHYGHDKNGILLVEKIGKRLHIPNAWINCGKVACKWHMKAGFFSSMTPKKQCELIEQVDKSPLGLEGLKQVVMADKNRIEKNEVNFDQIGKECIEKITGRKIKEEFSYLEGEKIKKKIHEQRVEWLRKNRGKIK